MMAVKKNQIGTDEKDKNPRKFDIQREWEPIRAALSRGMGSEYLRLMDKLLKSDRDLWNACRVNTEDWFVGCIYSRTANRPDDEREAWDAARGLWYSFMWGLYGKELPIHTLQVADVPYVMQNLPAEFRLAD